MSFATYALRTLTLALLAGLSAPLFAQTQTPYEGTLIVPAQGSVIVEAEKFDRGGEGIAYHDNVTGNSGGQFRTEDVDIITSTDSPPGGYVVTNFETGEWLEYTVNIQVAGQYEIAVRASSNWTSVPRFHIEIDNRNVTGSVDVQRTGSWNTFAWNVKGGVSLPAGEHVLKLVSDAQYFDVNQIRITSTPTTPFAGVILLPSTLIEAEKFDNGGEGTAYHDLTPTNDGGAQLRNESVDIKASPDTGGGFVINNFQTGEWLVYTVNVAATGLYDIDLRAATGTFTNSAYHIEIDGANVTGPVVLPSTGNFGTFQWIGRKTVQLTAGQHVLKLVSDVQYFDVDQIRVTAVTHTPFINATPIRLPSTFEAEHFDKGGEGSAYHDTTTTNDGGAQFRNEAVDIKASPDTAGGDFVINNFQTGEWLVYTVDVATTGPYDIDLRAATGTFTTSTYHIEIDGADVTGPVVLPATGSFGSFQWIGKKTVQLSAGQHVLKLMSDVQYFDVNQIRVSPATGPSKPAALLFWSGFEGSTFLGDVRNCDGSPGGKGCRQDLLGTDSTGSTWPPRIGPGNTGGADFYLRPGAPSFPQSIDNEMFNDLPTVPRHTTGEDTRVHYAQINRDVCFTSNGSDCQPQDVYLMNPATYQGDMYISFWRKVDPNLVQKFGGQAWHVVFEWKSAGDQRVIAEIVNFGGSAPYWQIRRDNDANGPLPKEEYWRCPDKGIPTCGVGKVFVPPLTEWFKFQVFWHRSKFSDGRIWMAVNDTVIVDNHGPNIGDLDADIDRIMFLQLYSGVRTYPVFQWTDDVQIWSKVPVPGVDAKEGDPWFDPPYGLR